MLRLEGVSKAWGRGRFGARSLSLLGAAAVAPLALVLFRRFDPARTASFDRPGRRSAGDLLSAVARPLGRPLLALVERVSPDAALTFRARPPLVLVVAVGAALGVGLEADAVRQHVLPALFAILSIALANGATRERESGMEELVFSLPGRRPRFAMWKLISATVAALAISGVPIARLLLVEPAAGAAALVGVLFLATLSVALGIATGSPKTFMVVSLTLWYVALNAKGQPPALDYGGWWGRATAPGVGVWLAAAFVAAGVAVIAHLLRRARES